MAILKRRIKRKNSSDYDVVHFETDASLVLMNDGTTAEAAIAGKAPSNHRHNQIYAQPDIAVMLRRNLLIILRSISSLVLNPLTLLVLLHIMAVIVG